MIQYKIGPGSEAGPGPPLKLWIILILFSLTPLIVYACDLSPKRGGYYDTGAEILKIDDIHDELHVTFEFVGMRKISKFGLSREVLSFLKSRYKDGEIVKMTIFFQENSVGCEYSSQIYIDDIAINDLGCLHFKIPSDFNLKDHIHKFRDSFDREFNHTTKKDNTL